jgi:acyl-[acyl-carrier-protein]-phospholipid O-acyltransferase/long-chain-fatty-acid--[acyl-carrier-protein] ligase
LPDPKKGEQIVLVTDRQEAARELLLAWAQSHGVAEIAVPKKIISVSEVPVLGTGKLDYARVQNLAEQGVAALAAAPAEPAPEASKRDLKRRILGGVNKTRKKIEIAQGAAADEAPAAVNDNAEDLKDAASCTPGEQVES